MVELSTYLSLKYRKRCDEQPIQWKGRGYWRALPKGSQSLQNARNLNRSHRGNAQDDEVLSPRLFCSRQKPSGPVRTPVVLQNDSIYFDSGLRPYQMGPAGPAAESPQCCTSSRSRSKRSAIAHRHGTLSRKTEKMGCQRSWKPSKVSANDPKVLPKYRIV